MRQPTRGLKRWLVVCLLLPLAALAAAEDEEAAEAPDDEELTRYEVEVIVFRQWELGGSDAERWPERVPEPHFPIWQVPLGCNDGAPADIEADEDHELVCLPGERRQLTGEWRRMAQSGDYRPLYHLAWEQPGYPEERSVAVPVPLSWQPLPPEQALGLEPAPPRLEPTVYGLLRVHRERFLHAVVDLRFHRRGSGQEVDVDELLRAPVHAMREARRMRSGELHYLDHPAMGVLIEIRRAGEDPDS